MFRRLLERRALKRTQERCPHEWYIVSEYRETIYNGYDIDFIDAVDLYCPICDLDRNSVESFEAQKILKKQQIRESYM